MTDKQTPTAHVQYMRGYSIDEIAELQGKVQKLFTETPGIVVAAVLTMELLNRLRGERCADDPPTVPPTCADLPAPEPIQRAIHGLEAVAPFLVGLAHDGLARKEVIS